MLSATAAVVAPPAVAASRSGTAPQLLGLSPGAGESYSKVIIRGRNLDGVTSVSFGSASATRITRVSEHRLRMLVPHHAPGTVAVRLHRGAQTSAAGTYRYTRPPHPIAFGPVESVEPSHQSFFTDVSCADPRWCAAVDSTGNAFVWASDSWSGPDEIAAGSLVAISCTPGRTCVAIDDRRAITFEDGDWSQPETIDAGARLVDVSCAPAGFCAAVDDSGRVITRRGGQTWSAPDKINPLRLTAISCPTAHACVATGLEPDPSFATGVARVMRDGGWPVIAHANHGRFYDVACRSARNCLLLGDPGYVFWHDNTQSQPILPRHGGNETVSVTCAGPAFCLGSAGASESDQDEIGGSWVLDGAATLHQQLPGTPKVSCTLGPSGPVCMLVVGHGAAVGRQ